MGRFDRLLHPRRRLVAALAALAAFALAVEGVGRLAERSALASLAAEARSALPLASSALRAEIDRQRAVPVVLAEESTVRAVLAEPTPERLAGADELLRRIADGTRASVVYLVDRGGRAIAASNYREPDSFVGNDFRFRQYVQRALAQGRAEQYALGTVSRRPGLYISQRIGTAQAPLGVVVAKVELDRVEAEWRQTGRPVFAADGRGIVLATSVPDWRFRTLEPVAAEEATAYRESLQFGEAPLTPLPLSAAGAPDLVRLAAGSDTGASPGRYVEVSGAVEGGPEGWRLTILAPAGAALAQAGFLARLLTALALALLAAAAAFVWRRRTREARRRAEMVRNAAALEARVAERTTELTEAYRDLQREMAERREAEAKTLRLRDDLAQANRLATLGQIAAGVAHEINQPVAAIRTYAENAGRFLDVGEPDTARANMGTVVGLTARIGAITETLRGLARRARRPSERLALSDVVDGALTILASRIAESGATVERVGEEALRVEADRIGLEQVLVNLLRNALDALAGTPEPRIRIETGGGAGVARLTVSDNGPGLSPDEAERLFTPFSTSKPQGLGLGLVISQDIVTELGGRLTAGTVPDGGVAFTIELPEAGS